MVAPTRPGGQRYPISGSPQNHLPLVSHGTHSDAHSAVAVRPLGGWPSAHMSGLSADGLQLTCQASPLVALGGCWPRPGNSLVGYSDDVEAVDFCRSALSGF